MRTKIKCLLVAPLLVLTLAACNWGDVDGNIINTRMDNGQYQVQVKEFVGQTLENAPWVDVPADKAQACTTGDKYPQCLDN
jgi:hypothetical protein